MRLLLAAFIIFSIWYTDTSAKYVTKNPISEIIEDSKRIALKNPRYPIIAVVDTGYDTNDTVIDNAIYRVNGEKVEYDYTGEGIHDEYGHGTVIIRDILAINPNARIVPIKVYSLESAKKKNIDWDALTKAFAKITLIPEIGIVNYSSAGKDRHDVEEFLIKTIVHTGRVFVSSAGNSGKEITSRERMYPASYKIPGAIIVAGEEDGKVFTNYSREYVDFSLDGVSGFIYKNLVNRGSSISAGYVSGLVSLHKMVKPQATQKEVYERLKLFSQRNGVTKHGSISIKNYIKSLNNTVTVANND